MKMKTNDLLTIKEFSEKLRVHKNTVYRAIKKGHITAFKVGVGSRSGYRIPISELDRMALFNLETIVAKMVDQKEKAP